MVDAEKIAVCLSCGNEWEVRTAGAKKRKCPLCGKYRTKMKGEMTADELAAAKAGHPEENPPEKKENNGEEEEKSRRREENSPEKKENSPEESGGEKGEEKKGEGFLLYVGVLALAVAAGYFLYRAVLTRRAENYDSEEYAEVRRYGVRA